MPQFSRNSNDRLNTCHPKLQELFRKVVEIVDCSVVCGHRSKEDQDYAVASGTSKLKFPNSKHNSEPSLAVDVVPYPVDWNDTKRFFYFAGIVLATASSLGIKLRWGGDWNRNQIFTDEKFVDLPHFELVLDESPTGIAISDSAPENSQG